MGRARMSNVATPGTPASGYTTIFPNTSKRYSQIDDAGAVRVFVGQDSTDTGTGRLQNKELDDATVAFVDDADTAKKFKVQCSGITTGNTRTWTVPDVSDTFAGVTATQDLTNKRIALAAGSSSVAPIDFVAGTSLSSSSAGAVEYDGTAFFSTLDTTSGQAQQQNAQIFRLTADGGAIGAGIADYFGANSAFPFVLNGVYLFEFHCYFLKTTAGTVTWTLTSTQNYTNLNAYWMGNVITGFAATGAMSFAAVDKQTTAATALPVTGSLTTGVDHYYLIRAVVEFATAGNFRLRATESAGTITPRRGSYYTATRLFAGNVGTFVA